MPFVYDQTTVQWPDDGSGPPPPRVDQFVYMPPPQFGGAREPVRFSDAPPGPPDETQATADQPPRRGVLFRLLALLSSTDMSRVNAYERERRQRERLHEQRRQQRFAVIIPALREIGARRVHGRYDGGNDEGFAWLDSVELRGGERIDADALSQRLFDIRAHDRLYATGLMQHLEGIADREQLKDVVGDWLCVECATMLLGVGYGTGEYSMYGAFTVDLETCTIADDPHADPVVENIAIAT